MKKHFLLISTLSVLLSCTSSQTPPPAYTAEEVKAEMQRAWNAYREYAWGYDNLLPLSKKGSNWYKHSLGISPIDAYSTLIVMGLKDEAKEVELYALERNWEQDVFVQVFEVNIRILGGLLAIYEWSRNPEILNKAIDFGNRILPAFQKSTTGIPYHSVNLKTGEVAGNHGEGAGNVVNVAQAATYLFEFGVLSYYAQDPKYYQAAKRATLAIYNRSSELGLPGENINVETGEWVGDWSHLQAGVDSYYEYMFKSSYLFGDPEIAQLWKASAQRIEKYYAEDYQGKRFYPVVNMYTGELEKRSISLYDAFLPAVQALSGDVANAEKGLKTWDWLWDKYGLLPTRYHYGKDSIEYADSELNPEIIESNYYLHEITGKQQYMEQAYKYWRDMKNCCRNQVAFNSIKDVAKMEKKDYLATYFFAETLKYFYLTVAGSEVFKFEDHVFNTEAHPFKISNFSKKKAKVYLGY